MTTIVFIREMGRRFPREFFLSVFLLFLSGGLETLTLLTLVPVVDLFSLPNLSTAGPVTQRFIETLRSVGLTPTMSNMMIVLLALQALSSAVFILAAHSILRTKYAAVREVMGDAFDEFFSARWSFFSSNSQGTLLTTFTSAVVQVGNAFSGIGLLLIAGARLVSYMAVPLAISWQITLFCVGLTALVAWPFLRLGKISFRLGKSNMDTANETMALLHASLGGAKVVLGYGNQKKNSDALRREFQKHCEATIKFQTLTQAIPAAYKPLGLGILVLTLLLSRHLGVPLSEIGVMMLAFLHMIPQVGYLASNKSNIQNLLPAYEQIERLRGEARRLVQRSGPRPFVSFEREIVLDQVSFSYPDRPPILTDITLRIPKGRFVAIVGESGAGKSTFVDLLMALHEPTGGRITLDGVPLHEFEVGSYRRRIGYVPQENVLFNQSIRDNLLWANAEASEDDIRSACRRANATEFIEKLPQGFDTFVGDRGVRLSGGQAQRISLARAILRKPFLLILDEATSSLDTHSERMIQSAVESLSHETTVIAVAHRLSTIVNADKIILLQHGKIAEEGSYSSLMNQRGLFYRMGHLQGLSVR
ncbi:MAG: ABC transporter ATP-binding protein [Elusimicrobia bacterium]|nr:ABC transporter ATP-binding protein [Elusimicrobiota bacterium]